MLIICAEVPLPFLLQHEGATTPLRDRRSRLDVSIHAPVRRTDHRKSWLYGVTRVSIRAPVRRDIATGQLRFLAMWRFRSTRPVEARPSLITPIHSSRPRFDPRARGLRAPGPVRRSERAVQSRP